MVHFTFRSCEKLEKLVLHKWRPTKDCRDQDFRFKSDRNFLKIFFYKTTVVANARDDSITQCEL